MTALAAAPRAAGISARQKALWGGMALLSCGLVLVSFRYLSGRVPVPATIAANRNVHPWLVLHAVGAATALLLGPFQVLRTLRRRRPGLHRAAGRLYVAGCLAGGVAALMLSAGVSAGPVAGAGFGALGYAWLATTGLAVRRILVGDVAGHGRWMVRSFALTLSAVTLRLYLVLSGALGLDQLAAYQVIAWLC